MSTTGAISIFLILANVLFSYRGLTSQVFFDKYEFEVDKVFLQKDYKRLITSGFLHVSWGHLIFNMLSLYFFSSGIELILGSSAYLLIYFGSLLGGNLLALFLHRGHGDYSSVGASGAVCGIMFASIAVFPGMHIGLFFLPVSIPGWLYGLIYVLISIYGIRSNRDNIGHDAHLGGGLIGLLIAIALHPAALADNYFAILIIGLPAIAFLILIINRPHALLVDNFFYKSHHSNLTIDQRYNLDKANRQHEVDRILEKIHRRGMNSLTQKEKDLLEEYSRSQR